MSGIATVTVSVAALNAAVAVVPKVSLVWINHTRSVVSDLERDEMEPNGMKRIDPREK